MKRFLLSVASWFFVAGVMAQDFNVNGNISNVFDGTPVSGQLVFVVADPSPVLPDSAAWGNNAYFFANLTTDFNGHFEVDIPGAAVPGTPMNIWLLTDSCATQITRSLSNANGTVSSATENFVQCHNGYVTCDAWFSAIDSMHTGNVIFDAYNPTPGATYTWDFGDGTSASGVDLLHVSHNYAPGTYVVTLTKYMFSIGCSATVSNTIEVVPGTCIADFINVTPPDVIDTLYLANNSTYSPTMTFTWDFGDGTILTGPNPYHIYGSSGTYNICLTISDASGCLDTYCMVFTINLMSGNGERSGFPVIFLPLVYGSTLGVEDENQNVEFSVYPNPAKDNLMISFGTNFPEQADVQIYDLSGRVIKTFSVHRIADSGVINLEGVAAGTYSISITDKVSGSTSSVLFVKE